jgi:hypothetical protein
MIQFCNASAVRIWRTDVAVGRAKQSEEPVLRKPIPMFRSQPAFLGLLCVPMLKDAS